MANLGNNFGFEELERLNKETYVLAGDGESGIGKYKADRNVITYDGDSRPVITYTHPFTGEEKTGEYLLDFEKNYEQNLIARENAIKEQVIEKEIKSDDDDGSGDSDTRTTVP